MISNWNYGDAYLRHPCDQGEIAFADGSMAKSCDLTREMPDFMKRADLLFIDPPWTQSNLSAFYAKAGLICEIEYPAFLEALFERIAQIAPNTCYVEIGKEYLPETVISMRKLFPQVTFYNSYYYHRSHNLCYVVRGGKKRPRARLDGLDEEEIIEWICNNETYSCIGDLCMGRGLVGVNAFKNNKPFVATELNHRRLSVLLEQIIKLGGAYKKV